MLNQAHLTEFVFHGLTAVAELKPHPTSRIVEIDSVVVFHGLTAVAELEAASAAASALGP